MTTDADSLNDDLLEAERAVLREVAAQIGDSMIVELDPLAGEPYLPDVAVQLTGRDGNAGVIMGAVTSAMRRAGVPTVAIDQYRRSSIAGTYDQLVQTAMRWVDVS